MSLLVPTDKHWVATATTDIPGPPAAAPQVASCCRDLRKHSGLRTACITGGADRQQQVEALGKQVGEEGGGGGGGGGRLLNSV